MRHRTEHPREWGSHFLNGPILESPDALRQVTWNHLLCRVPSRPWGSSVVKQLGYEGNAPRSPAPAAQFCSPRPRQPSQYLSSRPSLSQSTTTTLCLLFIPEKKTTDWLNVTDKQGDNMSVIHSPLRKDPSVWLAFNESWIKLRKILKGFLGGSVGKDSAC